MMMFYNENEAKCHIHLEEMMIEMIDETNEGEIMRKRKAALLIFLWGSMYESYRSGDDEVTWNWL